MPHGGDAPAGAVLTPGSWLGRYEIAGLLGAGGMGFVYRAFDHTLGREVALKAPAGCHRDALELCRFCREARVVAALSHSNIAAIHGVEYLEGVPYLVLEHVEGDTLAERLRLGRMPLGEVLAVAAQIVEGLCAAHAKGVVHCDLKPANVMVGVDGQAKLVDFGLARIVSRANEHRPTGPIGVGDVFGTARYMSPEQVRRQEVDARTDIWAFGCVFYEMLSGRPAFEGPSAAEMLAAVLRDQPDWEALPAGIPLAARRLLRRCLARDPRRRHQSIGDVRLELAAAQAEWQTSSSCHTGLAGAHARHNRARSSGHSARQPPVAQEVRRRRAR
jgi:eukaryotic-like serine/threonine-protein kinase